MPKSKLLPENAVWSEEPPYRKQMIWAEESRAEMVLGRNDPAVRRGQSFDTRPYGSQLKINIERVLFSAQKNKKKVRFYLYSVIYMYARNQ